MSRLAAARQPQLTNEELEQLRESIQLFDQSKYKSSLKLAEALLAKHPDHAEALAVKALCQAQFASTQKASIELASRATRSNTRSFLCWHALAICNRKNRNYAEALRAYSQAAKIDPNNGMIVREVALMSTMLREYAPVIDLRLTSLRMMPHIRMSWIQLALAHHLAGSLPQALRVLEEYEATIKEQPAKSFDQSETWLYHAMLLIELERYEEAVDLLDLNAETILDINARAELMGQTYLKLERLAEAEKEYRFLLERNPHSAAYVEGYLLTKGIDVAKGAAQEQTLPVVQELESSWPDSLAIRAAGLKLLSGPEFEKRIESHFTWACQKGVPSLFNSLKQYYSQPEKRNFIGALAEKYRLAWQTAALAEEDNPTESPSAYLWSLYFLAQHYSYIGDADRAKAYIQSAIAHTPTLPELHMTRARILKRTGDLHAAADAAETARLLDGQDRYVNCKSVKYALRINDTKTANELAGKFTMKIAPTPASDLVDMQAFWFMSEEVAAYLRKGQYAMALKRLGNIQNTKETLWAEQVDFHGWAARKFNLRAYLRAVKYWDNTRSHPAAIKAQLQTAELCCKLHDHPELITNEVAAVERQKAIEQEAVKAQQSADATPKLTPGQKKKLKAKQKAEAAKKAQADASSEDIEPKQPDADPEGIEALKALEPLVLAQETCEELQRFAPDQAGTWVATFEWAVRAEKWLVAIRAAKQLEQIDPAHPALHLASLRLNTGKPHVSSGGKAVKAAFASALASLAPSSLEAKHAEFVQKHSESPAHILAAAQGLLLIAPPRKGNVTVRRDEVVQLLLNLSKLTSTSLAPCPGQINADVGPYKDANLRALLAGLDLLRDAAVAAPSEAVDEYLTAARKTWPDCDAFKSEATLAQQAEERKTARDHWEATANTPSGTAHRIL